VDTGSLEAFINAKVRIEKFPDCENEVM